VHLIEVTKTSRKVKKVKIAYIDRVVDPSTETFNTYYSQAAQFAGKILNEGIAFDSLVAENNLVKRNDSKVAADKQAISGLPNSREMVKWMNTNEAGSVSEVFQFENSYVVAYLTKEYAEGVTDLEDIKEQITALVIKEKKATKIAEGISLSDDLATIATNNSTTVVSAQKATLANLSVQGIGYEPELVGSIFGTLVNTTSAPITGKNAVYVVEVTAVDEVKSTGDFTQQKANIVRQASSAASGQSYNALKEDADVIDNRSDFY
jgi:peptidyl-prolyl cis-trans isomerase D